MKPSPAGRRALGTYLPTPPPPPRTVAPRTTSNCRASASPRAAARGCRFCRQMVSTCRQMVDKKAAHDIDDGSCRHVGRGDDHLPPSSRRRSVCVDSARTVWDFHRTTLASGVWRTYLPTLRAVPTEGRTYLPTPRAYLSGGLPTMKKHTPQRPGGREPESDPSGRIGVSRGDLTDGWCGKRRSILATVPAVSTPLARSAPPARCPEPISGTIYRIPLLRSPITTPEARAPTSTSPVSDCTVPCHVMVHPKYAYSSALLRADLP